MKYAISDVVEIVIKDKDDNVVFVTEGLPSDNIKVVKENNIFDIKLTSVSNKLKKIVNNDD